MGSIRQEQNFLSAYLGGGLFLASYTLSFNGKSLATDDALVDIGANSYLFVGIKFG